MFLLWGELLNYTEKEKKGIDKVERMNRLFDKILMPAVGILIIMLLISFTINKYREKFGSGDSLSAKEVYAEEEPRVFTLRRSLLSGYGGHEKEFESYGYKPVEGYSYALSLCKQVDDEMSIFQFADGTLGELTIINYIPKEKKSPYDSLSLAVSSHKLINVTAKSGGEKHTVTFLSSDFSKYSSDDEEQFDSLMKLTDMEEISSVYEIFETDIINLSKVIDG